MAQTTMTERASDMCERLQATARDTFGWDTLRPAQLEAMQALMTGRDALVVMATGAGKSAIYQVPAVLLTGTTLVISPLIALQEDQIAGIDSAGAPRAVAINSTRSARDLEATWRAVEKHEAEYVFVAPEQLANSDVISRFEAANVSLIVVDEAHCVAAWGHDFRPDYLRIADTVRRLGHPPVLALTATAPPPVRQEIIDRLALDDPAVVATGFDRPNITLEVDRYVNRADKERAVLDRVPDLPQPGLLYTATRKDAEFYAEELSDRGLRTAAYHAGMKRSEREAVHEQFLDGRFDVVAATSAFGMGIDKPDVRFVVHASVPDSLDNYYQQLGRAGRDGESALALLFYRPEELSLGRFFASHRPDEDFLAQVFELLRSGGRTKIKDLRAALDAGSRKVTAAINLLEQVDAVAGEGRGFTARDLSADEALRRATDRAAAEERLARSRVEMLREYADTRNCRRSFLLGYFGEAFDPPCGNCDRCCATESTEHPEPTDEAAACDQDAPWPVDTAVEHSEWGPGTVMSTAPDRITVLFDDHGYRTLSVAAVEESGVLRSR